MKLYFKMTVINWPLMFWKSLAFEPTNKKNVVERTFSFDTMITLYSLHVYGFKKLYLEV